MAWKTFLVLYFKSGTKVSDVVKKVTSIGFECTIGPVDFVYKWKDKPTKEQIIELGDQVSETLKGTEIMFNLDTQSTWSG